MLVSSYSMIAQAFYNYNSRDMALSIIEQKIWNILEPVAETLGYEIVKISMHGSNRKILDIAIDKKDGTSVTIRDCKTASNNFSAILDVEEIIPDKYYLEVGSSGVERPLVKLQDFDRFAGRLIFLKTHHAIMESKKFQGEILGRKDEIIDIKLSSGEVLVFEYSNIKAANLVFTDEMFRKSLAQSEKEEIVEIEKEEL